MSSKSFGFFALVLAFLLGIVVACLFGPSGSQIVDWTFGRRPPTVNPAVQSLGVGPTADVVQAQEIRLHALTKDRIVWKALDPDGKVDKLYIDFDDDAFTSTTPTSDTPPKYRVICSGAGCATGDIKVVQPYKPFYKYSQTLLYKDGHKDYQDARVIIQW